MERTKLLLHPVRMRIVQSMLGRSTLTTAELSAQLGDVAPATLYRHISTLIEAGVVRVTDERKVRGAVERTLQLDTSALSADPDADDATDDDLRAGFLAYLASLDTAFDAYVRSRTASLADDLVGFRQLAVTVTDDEWIDALAAIRGVLAPLVDRHEAPAGARRRLFATVTLPAP